MYVLVIYAILACFLVGITLKEKTNTRRFELILSGIVMFIFLFRFNLGPDYGTYHFIFESVSNPIVDMFQAHALRNVGFATLAFLSKSIVHSYPFFMFVCNFISIGLCGYTIYKYSDSILLSTILFIGSGIVMIYLGSGLRQMLAMSLFFFAFYVFFRKKKYFKYELMILLACSFHEASVLGLLFPLIDLLLPHFEKYKKTYLIGCTILSVGIGIALVHILPIIARFFGNGYSAITHVFSYFLENPQISIMGLGMEVVFVLMIVGLYYFADHLKLDPFVSLEMTITFVLFFVYLMFMRYPIVSRICDFYQIIFLILIPRLWASILDKNKKVLCLLGVLLLNAFLLYSDVNYTIALLNNSYGYTFNLMNFPYTSVFNQIKCNEYIQVLMK